MAQLCQARGELQQAAQWCRKVIDFMQSHPEMFNARDEASFRRRIARLDPGTS
jgi:hypothetical protein